MVRNSGWCFGCWEKTGKGYPLYERFFRWTSACGASGHAFPAGGADRAGSSVAWYLGRRPVCDFRYLQAGHGIAVQSGPTFQNPCAPPAAGDPRCGGGLFGHCQSAVLFPGKLSGPVSLSVCRPDRRHAAVPLPGSGRAGAYTCFLGVHGGGIPGGPGPAGNPQRAVGQDRPPTLAGISSVASAWRSASLRPV